MAKESLAQGRSMPERVFFNPEGGELQASSVVKPYRRILAKAGLRRLRYPPRTLKKSPSKAIQITH